MDNAEIPLASRLDKSLNFTRLHLKKGKSGLDNSSLNREGDSKLTDTNFQLLLENQRIEDAYLIKDAQTKMIASELQDKEEQVLNLKSAHEEAQANLKNVLKDLQLAILENQKLNSEKIIDNTNIANVQAENQDLTRKLHHLEKRFDDFVQDALKMSAREGELIKIVEEFDDKLLNKELELEKAHKNSQELLKENDCLIQVSIGLERLVKDLENKELKSLEELKDISTKFQALEQEKLKNSWAQDSFNSEVSALRDKCIRQENFFKEKLKAELNRLKTEYTAEKVKLAKEIDSLSAKNYDLQMISERAIRDKRSAESELNKLLHVIPNQTDALEGMIEDLNRRLVASEKQRTEAIYSAEAMHQKFMSQLSARDLEQSSYFSEISIADERARKAEYESEKVSADNLNLITKISTLEKTLAASVDSKNLLVASHELKRNHIKEEYERKICQLEKTVMETKSSAESSAKEVHELLSQQQMLSSRKQEADQLCKRHDSSLSHLKLQMSKIQERSAQLEEERLKLKAIKSDLIKQIGMERQENAALSERLNLSESRILSLERQIAALIGKQSLRILERNDMKPLDIL